MLFRRREPESIFERLRVHLWPRRSWSRSTRYFIYRLRRLKASPHAIALGFSAGAFVAVMPYLGTHMVLAALLAWAFGASIVGALLGTFVGNPITYPLFWYASYKIGNLVLGSEASLSSIDIQHGIFHPSFRDLWPILKPLTLGALLLGLAVAALSYVLVKPMVNTYQHRRERQLRQNRDAARA